MTFDTDHERRVSGNAKGKLFHPKSFGPRPIPSAQFSYDFNQCASWFDKWLERGGNVARDTVYLKRARDLNDLRTFDEKVHWARLEQRLYHRRPKPMQERRRGPVALIK